jgi:hypothetical protein
MYKTYIAVIIGGSLGCLLRWFFSMRLNNLFPNITFGTLLVNLLAGFIIGVSLAFFTRQPQLDPALEAISNNGILRWFVDIFYFFSRDSFLVTERQLYLGRDLRHDPRNGIPPDDGCRIFHCNTILNLPFTTEPP